MRISELARDVGVSADTIRFYEKQGLLGKAPRSAGGFRVYDDVAVDVLRFIIRAKRLGFSLTEVKHLLHLHQGAQGSRSEFRSLARKKLDDIEAKIDDLKRMRDALQPLVARCDGHGPLAGCPIVEALVGDAPVD